MKERPILFSATMVRAILEGRKTMTRRVIKEFPTIGYRWGGWIRDSSRKKNIGAAHVIPEGNSKYCATGYIAKKCPYGEIGDRLWVRETHHISHSGAVTYRADFSEDSDPFRAESCGEDCSMLGEKWVPSIYMRQKYSRITLEITNVRVERLQDITEDDAKREGVSWYPALNPVEMFQDLWEYINGTGSWEANPWVWVVEFKVVKS